MSEKELEPDLMNFFTKTPKIPLYIQPYISKQEFNSDIVVT